MLFALLSQNIVFRAPENLCGLHRCRASRTASSRRLRSSARSSRAAGASEGGSLRGKGERGGREGRRGERGREGAGGRSVACSSRTVGAAQATAVENV